MISPLQAQSFTGNVTNTDCTKLRDKHGDIWLVNDILVDGRVLMIAQVKENTPVMGVRQVDVIKTAVIREHEYSGWEVVG